MPCEETLSLNVKIFGEHTAKLNQSWCVVYANHYCISCGIIDCCFCILAFDDHTEEFRPSRRWKYDFIKRNRWCCRPWADDLAYTNDRFIAIEVAYLTVFCKSQFVFQIIQWEKNRLWASFAGTVSLVIIKRTFLKNDSVNRSMQSKFDQMFPSGAYNWLFEKLQSNLDLPFIQRPDDVRDIGCLPPLGNSDHCVIRLSLNTEGLNLPPPRWVKKHHMVDAAAVVLQARALDWWPRVFGRW